MSYTALYRKYRPQVFEDVIGQSHITETLENQIKSNRVGHAYLFTGSRGTGKTTCAKIFAKAVNCTDSKNGSPCLKCETCITLDDPSNLDILEIDAASNNKVDEIRELRERIKYPPVKGRYKVYIIDEVHMLTDSAFNALLKTLEEPPAHALFILATTEVHKLPATILSRCMRFDFHLVPQEVLFNHVKKIYDSEGKKYEEEAARYIAKAGEGSVRDSLSIADMCLNRSANTLTLAEVQEVLGAADPSKIQGLFAAIASGDLGSVLGEIDVLANVGKSMNVIAKDLISYARDVLAVKSGMEKLVIDTKENIEILKGYSAKYSVSQLAEIIQILSAADSDLRYAVSPKITLECVALRAARLVGLDLTALDARVAAIEGRLDNLPTAASTPPVNSANGKFVKKTREDNAENDNLNAVKNTVENFPENAQKSTLQHAANSAAETQSNSVAEKTENALKNAAFGGAIALPQDARAVWGRIITYLRSNESMQLYSLAGTHTDYEIVGSDLIIWANDGAEFLQFSDSDTLSAISRALKAEGKNINVRVEKRKGATDLDKEIDNLKKIAGNAPVNVKR